MAQFQRRDSSYRINKNNETKRVIDKLLLNFDEPLRRFPYDIDYFSPEQVHKILGFSTYALNQAIKTKRQFATRNDAILFTRRLWDKPRADACLGSDIVAKRCSMNDELWRRYTGLKQQGKTLDIDTVRRWVEQDMIKAELYPKEADYKAQWTKEEVAFIMLQKKTPKEDWQRLGLLKFVPSRRYSDLDQPPKWFTDKLQEQGKLEKILTDIKNVK
jgi:hypothetical protein